MIFKLLLKTIVETKQKNRQVDHSWKEGTLHDSSILQGCKSRGHKVKTNCRICRIALKTCGNEAGKQTGRSSSWKEGTSSILLGCKSRGHEVKTNCSFCRRTVVYKIENKVLPRRRGSKTVQRFHKLPYTTTSCCQGEKFHLIVFLALSCFITGCVRRRNW